MTESTGGRVFFPYSTSQLTEAFREVDQELRSQYNLTYVPTNRRKDGEFREIKVKVSRKSVNIRHRRGYFAPGEDTSGLFNSGLWAAIRAVFDQIWTIS